MGGIKWIKKTINKYPKIKDILIAILIMSGLGLLFGSIYWGIQREEAEFDIIRQNKGVAEAVIYEITYYKKDNSEQWNISTSQIAQYEFINSLFPENWRKYKNHIFKINTRHNNSCYPFTYIDIEYIDECYFQWRVDTNKTGPFLELKMYNKYDKKSE